LRKVMLCGLLVNFIVISKLPVRQVIPRSQNRAHRQLSKLPVRQVINHNYRGRVAYISKLPVRQVMIN